MHKTFLVNVESGCNSTLSVSIVDTQQVIIHHEPSCRLSAVRHPASFYIFFFHNNTSRLGQKARPSINVCAASAWGHHSLWTLQLKLAVTRRPFGPLTSKIIHGGTKQSSEHLRNKTGAKVSRSAGGVGWFVGFRHK